MSLAPLKTELHQQVFPSVVATKGDPAQAGKVIPHFNPVWMPN
jgi:hypothetical protein